MGQKIHPHSFRVALTKDWGSIAFHDKNDYMDAVNQDINIRKFVMKLCKPMNVEKVCIERYIKRIVIVIHRAKSREKRDDSVNYLEEIHKFALKELKTSKKLKLKKDSTQNSDLNIEVKFVTIENPDFSAYLIAENIAQNLSRRGSFRKEMKKPIAKIKNNINFTGIKIRVSGRLSGAEIARSEWYKEGKVPLGTLRSGVKYHHAEALTSYGMLGIKVWVIKDKRGV